MKFDCLLHPKKYNALVYFNKSCKHERQHSNRIQWEAKIEKLESLASPLESFQLTCFIILLRMSYKKYLQSSLMNIHCRDKWFMNSPSFWIMHCPLKSLVWKIET